MPVVVNAGKYRHRITIRHGFAATRDSFGERSTAGAVFCEAWAEKQDWGGSEINDYERETAQVLTKFLIRYKSGIEPEMIVEFDGDTYQITAVLDFDGTRKELVLMTYKIVS